MNIQSAGVKREIQRAELDKWRKKAYHNSKLYKERMKRWHDKRIKVKHFKLGNKVLLFISHLRLIGRDKLRSKWKEPYLINPSGQWREYCKYSSSPNYRNSKEIDIYDLSELDPPSMVTARP